VPQIQLVSIFLAVNVCSNCCGWALLCGAQITRLMNDNYAKKRAKDNLQHPCKCTRGTHSNRKSLWINEGATHGV